jgi:hypothetical protein
MWPRPKCYSATSALCDRQWSVTLSTLVTPQSAKAWRWWYSRPAVSLQRTPRESTYVRRPPHRVPRRCGTTLPIVGECSRRRRRLRTRGLARVLRGVGWGSAVRPSGQGRHTSAAPAAPPEPPSPTPAPSGVGHGHPVLQQIARPLEEGDVRLIRRELDPVTSAPRWSVDDGRKRRNGRGQPGPPAGTGASDSAGGEIWKAPSCLGQPSDPSALSAPSGAEPASPEPAGAATAATQSAGARGACVGPSPNSSARTYPSLLGTVRAQVLRRFVQGERLEPSGSTRAGTSDQGAISATSFSISRLRRQCARARSCPWFSSGKGGLSSKIPVRWIDLSSGISNRIGKRRATRAARQRRCASSSEKRSS